MRRRGLAAVVAGVLLVFVAGCGIPDDYEYSEPGSEDYAPVYDDEYSADDPSYDEDYDDSLYGESDTYEDSYEDDESHDDESHEDEYDSSYEDDCDSGYSGCVPSSAGDVDCADVSEEVEVYGSDPYGLDADGDGYGCEEYG